jgi:hypothetical protein
MIKMVDTDGDGQVSFHEFQTMIFRYVGEEEVKVTGGVGAGGAGAGGHGAKGGGKETKSAAMTAEKSQEKKAAVEECLKALELKAPDIKAILRRFPESGVCLSRLLPFLYLYVMCMMI